MATSEPVTRYTSLEEIYPPESIPYQQKRYQDLSQAFQAEFKALPKAVVRAPGRINLIGEHVDYCLFGVMPAAVEMDCLIAMGPVETTTTGGCSIHITNLDPSWPGTTIKATKTSGSAWKVEQAGGKRGDWVAYLGSALESVLNESFVEGSSKTPKSLNLMVTGSIPPGSGLSSSAALIVASLLAISEGNELLSPGSTKVTNAGLVKLAREAEAKIGVNSGGMDQSASVLSRRGAGLYVSFSPRLEVETVDLPQAKSETGEEEKLVMVIANSLAKHDLASDAKRQYNLRVMETLMGARILGKSLDILQGTREDKLQLRDIIGLVAGESQGAQGILTLAELERELENILPHVDRILGPDAEKRQKGFTVEEVIQASGMTQEAFKRVYLDYIEVDTSHQDNRFKLYHRVKHVYTESLRVLQVKRICQQVPASISKDQRETDVEIIGRLMKESHESCRDFFECSSVELEELVAVCQTAGSIGSRLSGAGWGGCVVSLLPASKEKAFIRALTDKQTGYSPYRTMADEALESVVFKTVPGSGAGVVILRS